MRIYAIGDLHLPGGQSKPMDVFGSHWEGHFERICQDWRTRVTQEDVVLLPGDFSWAMTMEEVLPDLQAVCALPGKKLLVRGNHDYWWSSLTRVRQALAPTGYALQNDALVLGDTVFAGTRGWTIVPPSSTNAQEQKIFTREQMRLRFSLQDAVRKGQGKPIVCMLHFPPFGEKLEDTPFTELLEEYGVHHCVYGHLHGEGLRAGFTGLRNGVEYHQTSCDGLNFKLYEVEN